MSGAVGSGMSNVGQMIRHASNGIDFVYVRERAARCRFGNNPWGHNRECPCLHKSNREAAVERSRKRLEWEEGMRGLGGRWAR